MNSLLRSREWQQHRRSGQMSNLEMWQWGWMQGEGELCIPRLGPCIGVMIYDEANSLAIGGHFPVRSKSLQTTENTMDAMLSQARRRVDRGSASMWIGSGVLFSETDNGELFPLEWRAASNAKTREHREWVQDVTARSLGDIPTQTEFYEDPVTGVHYSLDVASGEPLVTLTTRDMVSQVAE
jgi:hypothetical protein